MCGPHSYTSPLGDPSDWCVGREHCSSGSQSSCGRVQANARYSSTLEAGQSRRFTLHIGLMSRTNRTLKSLLYKYIYILFIYNEKVHIINMGKGGWSHC